MTSPVGVHGSGVLKRMLKIAQHFFHPNNPTEERKGIVLSRLLRGREYRDYSRGVDKD